ncbi:helix-turn-helix transcriptional regulator [Nocardia flavorosea]|uniref:Uncharacterized protein n=1 Tax=Nocardia flavorosea TaxID=53429 RepID=A0A846YNU1_9NOCA|nr:hypothetical protein [Nocardia flavorosea]NKY60775.1 hypothetical protein [Nocardia flavorosea]
MTETNYAVAPGEFLAEWMEENHVDQMADLLEASPGLVYELLDGYAAVTFSRAERLEGVTGIPVRAWLRFEEQYRADLARLAGQETVA